jgi:hypothetical protein
MTRSARLAYRIRWLLLCAAAACWALGAWWIAVPWLHEDSPGLWGTPAMWLGAWAKGEEASSLGAGLIYLAILLAMQCLFLRPRRGWAISLLREGRPMRTSVVGAAFIAMLTSVGLIATVLELPGWWYPLMDKPPPWGGIAVLGGILVLWAAWTAVFFIYWRQGDRYTQLGKMTRGLIAGSFLELIVAAPVQAFTTDRHQCYCARGSYTGLVFGGTAILWAFGPGVALLFWREKVRRERLLRGLPMTCDRCGYDLRGTSMAGRTTCPECGEPFAPGPPAKTDGTK